MTAKDAIKFIEENGAKLVDLRFTDFIGQWQHTTVPAHEITEDFFEDGLGFDGSSIRGWQAINNSDMIMLPDPATIKMEPYTEVPTAYMLCNIFDPISKERYTKDPRSIATKAIQYLQSTGLADTAYFGPEAEFFCFDNVQYDSTKNTSYYFLDSEEGDWNTGAEGKNLGYKIRPKEGYFPVPPLDSLFNLRNEMVMTMEEQGLYIENSHHEVSSGGQCEIDMRFNDMITMSDDLQTFKYIVKNTSMKYGKSATFMPKPLHNDNGSGMHVHQSLWKDGSRFSLVRSTQDFLRWLFTTSVVSSSTLIQSRHSLTLLQTLTRDLYLVSRLLFLLLTHQETDQLPSESQCTAHHQRLSVLK